MYHQLKLVNKQVLRGLMEIWTRGIVQDPRDITCLGYLNSQ